MSSLFEASGPIGWCFLLRKPRTAMSHVRPCELGSADCWPDGTWSPGSTSSQSRVRQRMAVLKLLHDQRLGRCAPDGGAQALACRDIDGRHCDRGGRAVSVSRAPGDPHRIEVDDTVPASSWSRRGGGCSGRLAPRCGLARHGSQRRSAGHRPRPRPRSGVPAPARVRAQEAQPLRRLADREGGAVAPPSRCPSRAGWPDCRSGPAGPSPSSASPPRTDCPGSCERRT